MKKAEDPRHLVRKKIVKELFAYDFYHDRPFAPEIKPILDSLPVIDIKIKKAAPNWPLEKINRIDLAILRLAIYEIIQKKEPYKVIIDEAIELAKQYGSEKSPQFINGALGAYMKHEQQNTKNNI